MPAPGDGRPLEGQLDGLDDLVDFGPVFERAVDKVTAPNRDTRQALHELVCILATRLHIERMILLPLLKSHPQAAAYSQNVPNRHHRVEHLLARIDRRHVSDPEIPTMFEELQTMVRANIAEQRPAAVAARAALSPSEALELATMLSRAVDTAMTRPHPHLSHRGVVGRVNTAVARRVDKVRRLAPLR